HGSARQDEELRRAAVRVLLVARRPARLEFAGEDLEVPEWPRGQQHLPAENAERERLPLAAPQHRRAGRTVRLEEVGDRDPEPVGDPPQRRDAGARPAALDLAQEALAEPGPLRDFPE